MNALRDDVNRMKSELGLRKRANCNSEEQEKFKEVRKKKEKLPKGVFYDSDSRSFFRVSEVETDVTNDEIQLLILFRQLKTQTSIKACLYFFVSLTVIALLIWFFVIANS